MVLDPLVLTVSILMSYIIYKILVKKKVEKKKIFLYTFLGVVLVLFVLSSTTSANTSIQVHPVTIERPKQLFSLSPTSIKLPTKFD
jgi:multisubunit Na+/H+ antiporter MnhB subunit